MLQEEYRREQAELAEQQAAQEAEVQQLLLQKQQAELEAARVAAAADAQESPARQNVKSISSSFEPDEIVQQLAGGGTQQKWEESLKSLKTEDRAGKENGSLQKSGSNLKPQNKSTSFRSMINVSSSQVLASSF